jgi:hypothetical protein
MTDQQKLKLIAIVVRALKRNNWGKAAMDARTKLIQAGHIRELEDAIDAAG